MAVLAASGSSNAPDGALSKPTRTVIQVVARSTIAGMFLIAGLSKGIDPLSSARAASVLNLPCPISDGVAIVSIVAGLEVLLASSLLLLRRQLWPIVGSAVLLAIFTAFLFKLLQVHNAPSCACLGWLFPAGDPETQTAAGVVRNVGLILVLAWLGTQVYLSRGSRHPGPRLSRVAPATARHGFTLVELLVCISIIALLIALALPAYRHSRLEAMRSASMSTLRQVHVGTELYATENAGAFPYLAAPAEPWRPIEVHGVTLPWFSYFDQASLVLSLVHPTFLDQREALVFSTEREGFEHTQIISSRFRMTDAVFASREYWKGQNPPDDLSLYAGTRTSDVLFPSSKGLFLDTELSALTTAHHRRGTAGPWIVGRADGGALLLPFDPAYEPPFLRPYGSVAWPVLTTIDGLAGRDF